MALNFWYYECDLGKTKGGFERLQRGIIITTSIERLFWAIDEVVDPYQVKITNDISHIKIAWECLYKLKRNEDGVDEIVNSRAIVDNDYDAVVLRDNVIWYEFRGCDCKSLHPVDYKSVHVSVR